MTIALAMCCNHVVREHPWRHQVTRVRARAKVAGDDEKMSRASSSAPSLGALSKRATAALRPKDGAAKTMSVHNSNGRVGTAPVGCDKWALREHVWQSALGAVLAVVDDPKPCSLVGANIEVLRPVCWHGTRIIKKDAEAVVAGEDSVECGEQVR